jgi:hypothetical protein
MLWGFSILVTIETRPKLIMTDSFVRRLTAFVRDEATIRNQRFDVNADFYANCFTALPAREYAGQQAGSAIVAVWCERSGDRARIPGKRG